MSVHENEASLWKVVSNHPKVGHEDVALLDEEVDNDQDGGEGVLVMILPGSISHTFRIIECQPEYEANPDGHCIARVEKDRIG